MLCTARANHLPASLAGSEAGFAGHTWDLCLPAADPRLYLTAEAAAQHITGLLAASTEIPGLFLKP